MDLTEVVEEPVFMEKDVLLSKAIPLLEKHSGVVVTDGGKYFGIVDDSVLINFAGDADKTKLERIAFKAPTLRAGSGVQDALNSFLHSGAKTLVVLEKGSAIGLLAKEAALKLLQQTNLLKGKKVHEAMSAPPQTIEEDASIAQAQALMREKKVSRLVVVDSQGRLSGVVTAKDIVSRVDLFHRKKFRENTFLPTARADVEKTLVREVMTPDPVTVAETESLKNAVSKMMERGVSSLVVADGTRAAGVLTARDVFEACAAIPAERVSIYGLREEEKVLKQSIFEEISLLAELLKKSMPLDSIALHVRSVVEGRKKRFEVRARASVGGRIFAASAPDIDARKQEWNLHLAVKEVLQELERILEKKFRRKPSRDTRERFEESVP